jgi:hypothetical protein
MNNLYMSTAFENIRKPEDIFEDLPLTTTNSRISNSGSFKKFKILRSSEKFWQRRRVHEPGVNENSNLNSNVKSQILRKFGEIQNDEQLKEDLKNIDRWVFDNLHKIRFFSQEQLGQRNTIAIKNMISSEKDKMLPNLDLKLLDLILREEQLLVSRIQFKSPAMNSQFPENNSATLQRVAVTADMINLEYNKQILMDLVKAKLCRCEGFAYKTENFLLMVAKMILMDLISSFKVLKVFKSHNIFHLKNLLAESKESLQLSMNNSAFAINHENHGLKIPKEFNFNIFEKALFDNFNLCSKEIKITKQRLNDFRDKINKKKHKLNEKNLKVSQLAHEVELRENPSDHKRKVGTVFYPQEFIVLSELKAQLSEIEAQNIKYSQKASQTIFKFQSENGQLMRYLEDLKFKKTLFYTKLKEMYYSLLLDEDYLIQQDKTIINVVKLLWSIKAEVKDDYFSNFLEPIHISFLYQYTQLHNEFIELRKQNNLQKKIIKEQLVSVYRSIVEEKESERISELRNTIFCFKTANVKILRRQKVKNGNADAFHWENVENTNEYFSKERKTEMPSSNTKRNALNAGSSSSRLNEVSEMLCQLKENFINVSVTRVSVNGKMDFTGMNAVWLKKLFTVFFGKKEAQFLINELMKMKNIKIKEISI